MSRDRYYAFMDVKGRTLQYNQAVEALEAVVKVQGEDAALRAFAEATWADREEAWARRYGLKRSSGHPCIARLLGKRCWYGGYKAEDAPPCRPPGTDHADLWIKNGRPVAYTSQPYGLSNDELHKLVAFCDRWGLEVKINTWPGGHFPGAVLWVEITPEDRPLWKLLGEVNQGD